MKKKFRFKNPFSWALTFITAGVAVASIAHATPEMDRLYALERVGLLRSWDNIDGLFAEYTDEAYRDFFKRQNRFVVQDITRANEILQKSNIPFRELIEDPAVLNQLARATRSDTILRTKITREGPQYRFHLDWLHAPKMGILASHDFTLSEPRDGSSFSIGNVKAELQMGVAALIKKLPFSGHVTGRHQNSITVTLGSDLNVRKGDTLVVATIEDVKRHPLLNTIADWQLSPTGKIEVDSVDGQMAFGHIVEETEGQQIKRYQKISRIIPRPDPEILSGDSESDLADGTSQMELDPMERSPKLGWASVGLWSGIFSRQFTTSSLAKTGSSLFVGAKADGEVWLTSQWFVDLGIGYGSTSGFSQSDLVQTSTSTSQDAGISALRLRLGAGYHFFSKLHQVYGPRGWVKLAYQTASYSMPVVVAGGVGPATFSGPLLGIGGELPLRDRIGGLITLDFGLLNSAGESNLTSGMSKSVTTVSFFVGGYYQHATRLRFRLGADVISHSSDFSDGSTLSHRVVTLGPAVLLYF